MLLFFKNGLLILRVLHALPPVLAGQFSAGGRWGGDVRSGTVERKTISELSHLYVRAYIYI